MTGPEHYKEAERLLDGSDAPYESDVEYANRLARAQVHATLALAAATAIPHAGQMPVPDCEAWEEVASAESAIARRLAEEVPDAG